MSVPGLDAPGDGLGWKLFTASGGGRLLQLRVLRFGLLQDGDVGVRVFP